MTTQAPLDTAFIKQLWRDVLVEGIRASNAAHRPTDPNAAVYVADEMVKRYVDRFEPGYDDADLVAVMDADHARIEAERAEYLAEVKAKQAEAKEADRRAGGPWNAGETLTRKSTGEPCTVLVENGKPTVYVRFAGGKKLNVQRDDLTWREPGTKDLATPDGETNGAPARHLEAVQ